MKNLGLLPQTLFLTARPASPASLCMALAMAFLILAGLRARAATAVWTNTAGGSWSTAANWSPNLVPGSGDVAVITNAGTYTVTLNVSASVAGFVLGGDSGIQTFNQNGQTFSLSGDGEVRTRGVFILSGGSYGGAGTNVVTGTFNWSAGVMSGSGTLQIALGGTLNITTASNHDVPDWRLRNAGTVAWTGGNVRGGTGTIIHNSGLWDAQSDNEVNADYGGVVSFSNAGTFRKSAGGGTTTIQGSVTFANTGEVEAQNGTLTLSGGGSNSGGFNVTSNAVVNFNSGFSFASGSGFTGAGQNRLVTGTHTMNGAITAENLELVGGTLAGTHILNGSFKWFGGDMNSAGSTTISGGSTLQILTASNHDLLNRALTNHGVVVWTGGNVRGGTGTIVHNAGLWDAQSNNEINAAYGGVVSFNNVGTFRKSAGSGTTIIQGSVTFANTGAVEVPVGTLTLSGGGSNGGGFNVAANAVVNFNSGFSFASGSALTGAGQNRLVAGTHTMNGAITTENLELVGATLAGIHVFNGLLKWSGGDMNSPGSTTISSGSTLRMLAGNDHDLLNRALTNHGVVVWTGGNVRGGTGTIVHNAGLWDAQSNNEINAAYGGVVSFNNVGTFRKSAGSGTTIIQGGVTFANTGAVEAQNGTLTLSGGGSNGGGFNVAANAVVNFNSGFSFASGSALTGQGQSRLVTGTHTINGLIIADNLELVGGTLAGNHTLNGSLKWFGGDMNVVGSTTISSGSTLRMLAGNDHDLLNRALTNHGVVVWTGGNVRGGTGTIVHNAGLWDAQSNNEINAAYGGVVSFNNAGTFRKSAGSGTTIIQGSVTFANTGAVEAQNGTLTLSGGGSNGGGFNVAANAVVNFNSGFSFASGSALTGQGQSRLVTGTHTINGLIIADNLELVGGTLAGNHTLNGSLKWFGGDMNVVGSTTISTNSTLQILTAGVHDLTSHALTNHGVVIWTGGPVRGNGTTRIYNFGLWDAQSDFDLNSDYAAGTVFNNAGTFRKSASAGTTTIQANLTFNNTGTLDAQTGTISVGTSRNLTGGTINIGISSLSSYGKVTLSGESGFAGNFSANLNGGYIPITNNSFPVITYGSLSGTFANHSLPFADAWTTNYSPTIFSLRVLNARPILASPTNQIVNELTLLTVTNTAIDLDVPTNTLTYALLASPAGASIDSSGIITWIPNEAQGPGTNLITTVVTDNGVPSLSATNSFWVAINEINFPPVMPPLVNTNIDELTTLTLTNSAIDSDIPLNSLAYVLTEAPVGATIDTNGVITWTPTEAHGPDTNTFTTVVTDTNLWAVNTQSFTVTNTFQVVVNEINVPPILTVPANAIIDELVAYSAQASAVDSDIPVNALTFALVAGPAGLTVSPGGAINWTPDESQGSTTNLVVIKATDFNPWAINPQQLSSTNSYQLVVNELNVAPVLPVIAATRVNELGTLSITNTASDADLPANPLTYTLLAAPLGAVIDTNGVITWTPTESQGPSTNTLTTVVTDTNSLAVNAMSLSTTNSFSVVVNEVNVAPVLTLPVDTIINELVAYTALATATDADLPANDLIFALVSGPAGLIVLPGGAINWTPDELQGPSTNTVLISVTDANPNAVNATSLSVTSSFEIVVNEINVPPVLTVPTNQAINELVAYSAVASAFDRDSPTNGLAFGLVSGPAGLVIDAATGLIMWTPTELQGPSTNVVAIRVTDTNPAAANTPSFSVTNTFALVVDEVNVAPVLGTLVDRTVDPGQTVSVTASATDADLPANSLSYTLVTAPAGVSLDGSTGLLRWRPGVAFAGTTNVIQVRVNDGGAPDLSDARSFSIVVNPFGPVSLTPLAYGSGQFRFRVTGPPDLDYIIQASGSLTDWTNIGTNLGGVTPFEFTDSSAPPTNRVYRIQLAP